jgi:hypothetical protein
VHGFKYGDRWRAEFNYPGNVKPRSTNKICANFSRQIVNDRGALAASTPAASGQRQSASLIARIHCRLLFHLQWRKRLPFE